MKRQQGGRWRTGFTPGPPGRASDSDPALSPRKYEINGPTSGLFKELKQLGSAARRRWPSCSYEEPPPVETSWTFHQTYALYCPRCSQHWKQQQRSAAQPAQWLLRCPSTSTARQRIFGTHTISLRELGLAAAKMVELARCTLYL